ncbi:hypothetical protein OUZ56_029374 [Daphnia magna]|uniref:Uncharacterized protein n=1 Tax=Daphnia magna TaxID=35525 RepID=A0ABR0B736_9CRUS|nr:hypothetical protein OUZ56_029374 [Daphnia magna]
METNGFHDSASILNRAQPRLAEIGKTDLIYAKNGRSVAIGSGPPETDRFRCGSSVRSGMATLTVNFSTIAVALFSTSVILKKANKKN